MEESSKQFINKARQSIHNAFKGQESVNIIVNYWGIPMYILCYLVFNNLILAIDLKIFDIFISFMISFYFICHIYVLHKCKPKKKKLTNDELKLIELENKNNRSKKVLRKIFLKEPIFKWNTITVVTAVDLLCITHFLNYFFN